MVFVFLQNNQTIRICVSQSRSKLAHRTIVVDSTLCGVAGADYLLIFRRAGKNEVPVEHKYGLFDYSEERQIPSELLQFRGYEGNQIENRYSHWIWRQYASSFWDDIRVDNVLPYRPARDKDDERHVHPLQLDVIERSISLYTNTGDIVFTPFMGVGSEVYSAVKMNRFGIGVELKKSYYKQAIKNLEAVEQDTLSQKRQISLLDFVDSDT